VELIVDFKKVVFEVCVVEILLAGLKQISILSILKTSFPLKLLLSAQKITSGLSLLLMELLEAVRALWQIFYTLRLNR
jgi:hypothetical protein